LTHEIAQVPRRRDSLALLTVCIDEDDDSGARDPSILHASLQRLAQAVRSTLRKSDIVSRLDNGQILALLPGASAENAHHVAEAIRLAAAEAGLTTALARPFTVSIGLGAYPEQAHDLATLREASAAALARARKLGGNRVVAAFDHATPPTLRAEPPD
jgi:diguanylate cyclase (GGDEF)-like protein